MKNCLDTKGIKLKYHTHVLLFSFCFLFLFVCFIVRLCVCFTPTHIPLSDFVHIILSLIFDTYQFSDTKPKPHHLYVVAPVDQQVHTYQQLTNRRYLQVLKHHSYCVGTLCCLNDVPLSFPAYHKCVRTTD